MKIQRGVDRQNGSGEPSRRLPDDAASGLPAKPIRLTDQDLLRTTAKGLFYLPREIERLGAKMDRNTDHQITLYRQALDISTEVIGMEVCWSDTTQVVGRVTNVLISPKQGMVTGFIWWGNSGQRYMVSLGDFRLNDKLWVNPQTVKSDIDYSFEDLIVTKIINRTVVLTNRGNLLGHISRVYLWLDDLSLFYCVAQNIWQRLSRRGFFISGLIIRNFTLDGAQMIVPIHTMDRYAYPTLDALMQSMEPEESQAPPRSPHRHGSLRSLGPKKR